MVETIRTGEYSFLPAPLVPFSGGQGDLENRRKIALAMMSRKEKAYPKNVGEGIASVGESIGDVLYQKSLADAEKKFADKETGQRGGAPIEDYLPGGQQAAVAGGDPKQAYAQQDPRTDEDVIPLLPERPAAPVGGEETGLPMPTTQPDMPNALTAALRTAPQRNQPGAPSTWGSGMLQQVPTDMASVAPGTFGQAGALQAEPAVFRPPPGPVPRDLAQPMPFDPLSVPAGANLQQPVPYLTGEQRNRIAASMMYPRVASPPSFNAASDQAAPTQDDQTAEKPELSTVGQGARQEAPGGFPSVDNIMLGPEPGTPNRGPQVTGSAAYGAQPAAAARANPPTIAQDITPAPDLPPSKQPIPPQSGPMIPPIPDEVKRPPRLGPSKAMQYWSQFIDNPNSSPEMRAHALRQYNLGEQYRKDLETRALDDYHNERSKRDAAILLREKLIREDPKRVIDELNARLQAEKAQADEADRPLDRQKKQTDIQKTLGEIEHLKQVIGRGEAPDVKKFDGAERVWDPVSRSYVRPTMTAVEPGELDMTEKQSNTVKFLQRATFASQHLAQNDAALARFWETAAGNVPVAGRLIGNYFRSPEYQAVKAQQMIWGHAVLRDESGALIGTDELAKKLDNYFPVPGDQPPVIAFKAQARKYEEDSLARSLGKARPVYDEFLRERATRKVDNPEKYTQGKRYKDPETGKVHIFLNGYMEDAP